MPDIQAVDLNSLKTNLIGLNRQSLEQYFADLGEKPFRAKQVMHWIHQQGVVDFDEMTNLSKNLREKLKLIACVDLPTLNTVQKSKD